MSNLLDKAEGLLSSSGQGQDYAQGNDSGPGDMGQGVPSDMQQGDQQQNNSGDMSSGGGNVGDREDQFVNNEVNSQLSKDGVPQSADKYVDEFVDKEAGNL